MTPQARISQLIEGTKSTLESLRELRRAKTVELIIEKDLNRRCPAIQRFTVPAPIRGKAKRVRSQAREVLSLKDPSSTSRCFLLVFPDGSATVHRAE